MRLAPGTLTPGNHQIELRFEESGLFSCSQSPSTTKFEHLAGIVCPPPRFQLRRRCAYKRPAVYSEEVGRALLMEYLVVDLVTGRVLSEYPSQEQALDEVVEERRAAGDETVNTLALMWRGLNRKTDSISGEDLLKLARSTR